MASMSYKLGWYRELDLRPLLGEGLLLCIAFPPGEGGDGEIVLPLTDEVLGGNYGKQD